MISKEKVSGWIENHTGLIDLCGLIAGIIGIIIGLAGLVITPTLTWRLIGKMTIAILFVVIIAISLFVTIKAAILLIRKPLNDEIKKLKANLSDATKKVTTHVLEISRHPHQTAPSNR